MINLIIVIIIKLFLLFLKNILELHKKKFKNILMNVLLVQLILLLKKK